MMSPVPPRPPSSTVSMDLSILEFHRNSHAAHPSSTEQNVLGVHPRCGMLSGLPPFTAEHSLMLMDHVLFVLFQLKGTWLISPFWLL